MWTDTSQVRFCERQRCHRRAWTMHGGVLHIHHYIYPTAGGSYRHQGYLFGEELRSGLVPKKSYHRRTNTVAHGLDTVKLASGNTRSDRVCLGDSAEEV